MTALFQTIGHDGPISLTRIRLRYIRISANVRNKICFQTISHGETHGYNFQKGRRSVGQYVNRSIGQCQ